MPVIVQSGNTPILVVKNDRTLDATGTKTKTVVVKRNPTAKTVQKSPEIVEVPDSSTVGVVEDNPSIVKVSSPGMRGPRGYDGVSGSVEISISRENGSPFLLLAGQAVSVSAGKWYPATAEPGPTSEAVGFIIEENGIAPGAIGRAQTGGILVLLPAQWDQVQTYIGGLVPETNYYLDISGKITPVPPFLSSGLMMARVGYAISSSDLIIEIEPTILL